MATRHTIIGIISVWIVAISISYGAVAFVHARPDYPLMRVSFFDVGQGDAIFIETPSGKQILVDAGMHKDILAELGKQMQPGDTHIDMIIATHPDADHIGGFADVIDRYTIDTYVHIDYEATTEVYKHFAKKVAERVPYHTVASIGDRIDSGDGVTLDVLSPLPFKKGKDPNDASIVIRVAFGDTSFFLTGDAPYHIENLLMDAYGTSLVSDVLKVGHHGSRTSTSDYFVSMLDPRIAIISAGKNNRYRHPHPEVLGVLDTHNVTVLGTYDEGTLTFISNGKAIWRN